MQEVEYQVTTSADALSDDKYFQTTNKIYLNLIWVRGEIGSGAGDVAGAADYGPTETEQSLGLELEKQMQAVEARYNTTP